MGCKGLMAFAASVAALSAPACAHATTVTIGNPNPALSTSEFGCFTPMLPCGEGTTWAQGFISLTTPYFPPAAGVITSWRAVGSGTLKLRVLESGPEGGWIGTGTSASATNLAGQPNPTSLPIGYGDLIGVDFPPGSPSSEIRLERNTSSQILEWHPALADNGTEREYTGVQNGVLELNAEVVLTPVLSSLSTASGSAMGGNAVKIAGLYLDGTTSVTFGSTPASSFSVDSANQITAIAPASAASTVDVRVSGPGGASAVGPADHYTFVGSATTTSANGTAPAKPTLRGFGQSASRWRRGRSLPRISSAGGAPVGTTFSFALNEPATASFSFTQRVPGRRVKGRCVATGAGNVGKPRCRRTVGVGSLSLAGHSGLDKVTFQGRLSSGKELKPGTYGVAITARDSRGVRARSQSLSFTIVS